MPNLRSALIRIASDLPKGDPTRREILSTLKSGAATMADFKKDMGKLERAFKKLVDFHTKAKREHRLIGEHMEYAAYSKKDFDGDAGPEHDQEQVMELGAKILAVTRPVEKRLLTIARKFQARVKGLTLNRSAKEHYRMLDDELRKIEGQIKGTPKDWREMSKAMGRTGPSLFTYMGAFMSRLVEDITDEQF
jgi:hypothetical protein